jgi:hypothetical protein
MAESGTNGTTATQGPIAAATTEVVTQMARSAAGELVKGQQPISEVARTVVSDAMTTLDKRGPELAKQAGIMTWRYAALGWVTWNVGKRVVKRKAKAALPGGTKGGQTDGAGSSDRGGRDDD